MRTASKTKQDNAIGVKNIIPWNIIKIKSLPNYKLELEFADGLHGFVDMTQLILSEKAGLFAELKDINVFNQAYIANGAATWPEEIDFCPETMHSMIEKYGTWVIEG